MQPSDAATAPEDLPAEFAPAAAALARTGRSAASAAWEILSQVGDGNGVNLVKELKSGAGLDGDSLERLLLWYACRQALDRADSVPLDTWVRTTLLTELRNYHAARGPLDCDNYSFVRAAEMATLRRFPAGCVDFVNSGIPRSWLPQAGFPGSFKLLWHLARLGGIKPLILLHVAPYPKNRALVLEKEVLKAYHRLARSLKLQPEMLGIFGHSWFYDPAALRDYPHLEPLNRPFLSCGGKVILLGPAPPDSGVLVGDAVRKQNYLAGKLQYRYGLALWPRAAALRWADENAQLAG